MLEFNMTQEEFKSMQKPSTRLCEVVEEFDNKHKALKETDIATYIVLLVITAFKAGVESEAVTQ